jgi:hypothetical protein
VSTDGPAAHRPVLWHRGPSAGLTGPEPSRAPSWTRGAQLLLSSGSSRPRTAPDPLFEKALRPCMGAGACATPRRERSRACRYLSGAVARYRSFEPTGTSPADLSTIGTGARIGLSPAAQVGPETVTLRCRSLRSARLGPSEPLSLNMPAGRITPIGASQDLREMSVRQVARRTINYLPSASSIPESAATSRPASTDFATATFSKPPMRW